MSYGYSPDEYNQLRSRMYNLYYSRKHLGRQIRRLLKDAQESHPEAFALAVRDGQGLNLHEELPSWASLHAPQQQRAEILEGLKTIFGSSYIDPATP